MNAPGTPEQGNTNFDNQPLPEGEGQSKGFQINVENPLLIYDFLKRGISGELGRCKLTNPVKEVCVSIDSNQDCFDIVGNISLNLETVLDTDYSNNEFMKFIAQKLVNNNPDGKIKYREGHFIITASRGTKFLIERQFKKVDRENLEYLHINDIFVSTGIYYPNYIDRLYRDIEAPILNRENYYAAMNDFIDVFKTIVEEVYKTDGGRIPPDQKLVLRPQPTYPAWKTNGAEGSLRYNEIPKQLSNVLEVEKPNIRFENIGGQNNAKIEIQKIAFALKNPQLYRKWGTKPIKGILFYGPPGTGKTLMAKALASQADARFFHVTVADIGSEWYSVSERTVNEIFQLAGNTGEKTIIFFDEIDAIAPPREGSHEATHRIISTLLENMDGLNSRDNIMVVASTNNLGLIEKALIRAGRFDRLVEVPLPDEEGKKQIFNIHMNEAQNRAGRNLFQTINLDVIVSKTPGYSGADIAEIIRRTLEEKVREEGTGMQTNEVSTEDILEEINNYERVKNTRRALGFINPDTMTE